MPAPFNFNLPPERRGIARDQVRLLVIDRENGERTRTRFDRIGEFLQTGDLLVFNSSRALPAALKGCAAKSAPCIEARLAEHLPDDSWLVLLLCQNGEPFGCGNMEDLERHLELPPALVFDEKTAGMLIEPERIIYLEKIS